MDARLCFLLLFITGFTVTLTQMPIDCCLSVTNRTINRRVVADYKPQHKGCSIDATIFVTRSERDFCAPVGEAWVEKLKRHVDNLRKHCKKVKYLGRRCFGVKPK